MLRKVIIAGLLVSVISTSIAFTPIREVFPRYYYTAFQDVKKGYPILLIKGKGVVNASTVLVNGRGDSTFVGIALADKDSGEVVPIYPFYGGIFKARAKNGKINSAHLGLLAKVKADSVDQANAVTIDTVGAAGIKHIPYGFYIIKVDSPYVYGYFKTPGVP